MLEICDINVVPRSAGQIWSIKALVIDGRCPVVASLEKWGRNSKADFKSIVKVMKIVISIDRVRNPSHVVKCADKSLGDIYEMRADKLNARIMYFYDVKKRFVICTNPYEKNEGLQINAF